MAITFGGLATGLDTNALIKELMAAERRPIRRLEQDKSFFKSRINALGQFEEKLTGLLSKIQKLDSAADLQAKKATLSSESYLTATPSSRAPQGNYQIEVLALAQAQKSASQGYTDKSAASFGVGTLTLTGAEGEPVEIVIDTGNNSLEGIASAINRADAGVTASIINDGTDSPYRLVLSGEQMASGFSFDASGLSSGDEGFSPPELFTTQEARQAHIRVDGIDIYHRGNTLTEAIPGVSLTLTQAEPGVLNNLSVTVDEEAVMDLVRDFVAGYNEVVSFVGSQSLTEGGEAGILSGDSGLNNVMRRLQSLLTTQVGSSIGSMSQLGLKTQKNGTLVLDESTLRDAVTNNLSGVTELLAGNDSETGIATRFKDYLESITDRIDGFYAGRKKNMERNVRRIDDNIERMEMRLEKREQTLRNQFNSLELLISSMNSTSNFLSAQLKSLENLWSGNR